MIEEGFAYAAQRRPWRALLIHEKVATAMLSRQDGGQ
jgi:hypothetical protein